jgi:hypothetical protein
MSFDVHFQRFRAGEACPGGGDAMRRVLAPFTQAEEPEHEFLRVEYGDGGADLFLDDDGMMANHVDGLRTWDLLVEGARAAGWVIFPTGCPTCITDEKQRSHLPEGLDEQVVLVRTGADLLGAIKSS